MMTRQEQIQQYGDEVNMIQICGRYNGTGFVRKNFLTLADAEKFVARKNLVDVDYILWLVNNPRPIRLS